MSRTALGNFDKGGIERADFFDWGDVVVVVIVDVDVDVDAVLRATADRVLNNAVAVVYCAVEYAHYFLCRGGFLFGGLLDLGLNVGGIVLLAVGLVLWF